MLELLDQQIKPFTIYWDHGVREKLWGKYPADAASKSENRETHGYDFENGEDFVFEWNPKHSKWDRITPILVAEVSEFKAPEFFEAVISQFESKGLTYVSRAAISTDTHNYHVNFCYPARHTTMVFHIPRKACILALTYAENCYTDTKKYSSRFSLRVYARVEDSYTTSVTPDIDDMYDDLESTARPYSVPKDPDFPAAHHAGWSSRCDDSRIWNVEFDTELTTEQLVESVSFGINQMREFIKSGVITERVEIEPTYCFKGCEDAFWLEFDRSKLDAILKSGYLTREQAWRIHRGLNFAPEETDTAQLLQLAMGGYIDEHGDLWCLKCNNPNECCNCQDVEDDALSDTNCIYECCEDTELDEILDKNVILNGAPLRPSSDDTAFCECGRTKELCQENPSECGILVGRDEGKCFLCNFKSNDVDALQAHFDTVHRKNKRRQLCQV